MKKFYSCVDTLIPSPLSEQHLIIKRKAEINDGKIVAYASEEYRTVAQQPWIYNKLKETPGVDGVIFFTAIQFLYGDTFNLKLFKKILDNDYEIHFARENFSFTKKNKNLESLDFLVLYSLVHNKKEEELFKVN